MCVFARHTGKLTTLPQTEILKDNNWWSVHYNQVQEHGCRQDAFIYVGVDTWHVCCLMFMFVINVGSVPNWHGVVVVCFYVG